MPLINKIQLEFGTVGIWELTESVEQLISCFQFTKTEKEEFVKIKADKRKREYLGARLLINELLQSKIEIGYLDSGKPLIKKTGFNLSISHSSNLLVVIISKDKIGIDVENTNRDIEKIANRFLHPDEKGFIEMLKEHKLAKVIYWSAKEAIFKCTDHSGIQFNRDIAIAPFEIKEKGNFVGTLCQGDQTYTYALNYLLFKNNVIVFCVEESK